MHSGLHARSAELEPVSGILTLGAPNHDRDKAVQPNECVLAPSLSFSNISELYL